MSRAYETPQHWGFSLHTLGWTDVLRRKGPGTGDARRWIPIEGTAAEYAATAGVEGPRPQTRFAVFRAGYVIGRSGREARRARSPRRTSTRIPPAR